MKKLKQALLSDLCRKHGQEKTSAAKRPCGSVKSKATVKKIPKENIPQDPKPADESKLKSFRTPLTSAKLNQPKKNKRSKSMICDKRFKTKIETTHNSSELAMQFNCIRLDQGNHIDEVLDFMNTGRIQPDFEEGQASYFGQQIESVSTHSPVSIPKKRDFSTQVKQILIEDAEVQCEEFKLEGNLRERMRCRQLEQKNSLLQQRHEQLEKRHGQLEEKKLLIQKQKQSIQQAYDALENKVETIIEEYQRNQQTLNQKHARQATQYHSQLRQLQEINANLVQDKQSMARIIHEQQTEIKGLKQAQESLEIRLKAEQAAKEAVVKANEELKHEVLFYKDELSSFEESLVQFRKMKNVYERRLDSLQLEKVRIKKHASELLHMVEMYKQQQANDD